jgi:acetyl esterase/lipase
MTVRFYSLIAALALPSAYAAEPPKPTHADVPYGKHPHQLIDIHLPPKGDGPFPVVLWYGGIWKAAKHAVDVNRFFPHGIAVIAVEVRTMEDATADKVKVPISYVLEDALSVVKFVRSNAAKWNLDPKHLALGGGSQGALPALYVGCVARDLVTCIAAYRCQPTIDPKRMQEWVPGVKWGAPALGCSFEDSLKRRDELLSIIQKWSPDWLLHKNAAPMYFENEWGLTKPDAITQENYDVHCPAWAIGFQKIALAAGATCYVKYPGHPTEGYDDIWNFIVKQLTAKTPTP